MERDSGPEVRGEQVERRSELATAFDILESDQERARLELMLRPLVGKGDHPPADA